jgi:putative ATPase
LAINKAMDDVKNKEAGKIPNYLRSTSYPGAENLGNGKGYKYPHDFKDNYVTQQYLPNEFKDTIYYEPSENGYEKVIKDRLSKLIDKDR